MTSKLIKKAKTILGKLDAFFSWIVSIIFIGYIVLATVDFVTGSLPSGWYFYFLHFLLIVIILIGILLIMLDDRTGTSWIIVVIALCTIAVSLKLSFLQSTITSELVRTNELLEDINFSLQRIGQP